MVSPLMVMAVLSSPVEDVPTYIPDRVQEVTVTQPSEGISEPEKIEEEEVEQYPNTSVRTYALKGERQEVVDAILAAFPEAPIMLEVARCESNLKPNADRSNLSVDVGLFQINQVHLPSLEKLGLDRRDMHDNIAYSRILFDRNGLGDWYMSEHCWAKYA